MNKIICTHGILINMLYSISTGRQLLRKKLRIRDDVEIDVLAILDRSFNFK